MWRRDEPWTRTDRLTLLAIALGALTAAAAIAIVPEFRRALHLSTSDEPESPASPDPDDKLIRGQSPASPDERTIRGQFAEQKALALMYGPKADCWPPTGLDAEIYFNRNLEIDKDACVTTTAVWSKQYQDSGEQKIGIVWYSAVEPNRCHACYPQTGLTVFVKTDAGWRVDADEKRLFFSGEWGRGPHVELVKVGPDKYGFMFYGDADFRNLGGLSDTLVMQAEQTFSKTVSIKRSDPERELKYVAYSFIPGVRRDLYALRLDAQQKQRNVVVPVTVIFEMSDEGTYLPVAWREGNRVTGPMARYK